MKLKKQWGRASFHHYIKERWELPQVKDAVDLQRQSPVGIPHYGFNAGNEVGLPLLFVGIVAGL